MKDIVLTDILGRLQYGVIGKCTYPVNNETTDGKDVLFTHDYEIEGIRRVGAGFAGDRRWYEITFDGETYGINDDGINVIPYLRRKSKMTEEERSAYFKLVRIRRFKRYAGVGKTKYGNKPYNKTTWSFAFYDTPTSIDYLNSIFVDFRGLIKQGLALEAPKDMYIMIKND